MLSDIHPKYLLTIYKKPFHLYSKKELYLHRLNYKVLISTLLFISVKFKFVYTALIFFSFINSINAITVVPIIGSP